MLGDAEVMPEVGCMPRGQRISPWSDGRPADGADREILFSLGRFWSYLEWKSPDQRQMGAPRGPMRGPERE